MTTWAPASASASAAGLAVRSSTVTSTPWASSARAAAAPATPVPATSTLNACPVHSLRGAQTRRLPSSLPLVGPDDAAPLPLASSMDHPEEVPVEEAEPDRHADPRDDPEPDHDVDLAPPGQLEMMVQRGHPEHPFTGGTERDDLDDQRQRGDHEEQADDEQEQLGTGGHRHPRDEPTERHRTGVAHEDPGRRRVPPQEAQAGSGGGARDQGHFER